MLMRAALSLFALLGLATAACADELHLPPPLRPIAPLDEIVLDTGVTNVPVYVNADTGSEQLCTQSGPQSGATVGSIKWQGGEWWILTNFNTGCDGWVRERAIRTTSAPQPPPPDPPDPPPPSTSVTETWGQNLNNTHRLTVVGGSPITRNVGLRSATPDTNRDGLNNCLTEWEAAGANWTCLLRFDLRKLPIGGSAPSASAEGIIIENAFVTMGVLNDVPTQVIVNGYELLINDWSQTAGTWNFSKAATAWNSAGARGAGTDVTGTSSTNTGAKMTCTVPATTATGTLITCSAITTYLQGLVEAETTGTADLNVAFHNPANEGQHVAWGAVSQAGDGFLPFLTVTYKCEGTCIFGTPDDPAPPPPAGGPGATGKYVAHTDGKIYDPQGNLFVVNGAYATPNQLDSASEIVFFGSSCWNFNTARLNHHNNQLSTTGDVAAVSAAIDTVRAAGLVVYPRWGHTGNYPPEPAFTNFIVAIADAYKSDPGVWINIGNEPPGRSTFEVNGNWSTSAINTWIAWAREHITDIRTLGGTVAFGSGNNNIIIVPTPIQAVDLLRTFDNDFSEKSAALKYGGQVKSGMGIASLGNATNIVFDVHFYNEWTDQGSGVGTFITTYDDAMQAAGHAYVFGEYNYRSAESGTIRIVSDRILFSTAATRTLNLVLWRWSTGSTYNTNVALVDNGGSNGSGGEWVNSCSNPTNLTDDASTSSSNNLGDLVWQHNHSQGSFILPGDVPANDDRWAEAFRKVA